MKKRVLLISNSNFFTVMTHLFLQKEYETSMFHLRFPKNQEKLTHQYAFQVKEMARESLFQKGVIGSVSEYYFSSSVRKGLGAKIDEFSPDIVIVDFKNLSASDPHLLRFLIETKKFPVLVYSDFVGDLNAFSVLDELGIKGCIWSMDKSLFVDTIEYHLNLMSP